MDTSPTDTRVVRFLLVEDNDDHAMLIQRHLRRSPVANEVARVVDGVEALRYLRLEGNYRDALPPDVVLLDLKLPKMDGHELLAVIKNDPELLHLPVVVLSTSAAEADRVRAYRNHANSYLIKPLDFRQFQQLIHDLSRYWGEWNLPPS